MTFSYDVAINNLKSDYQSLFKGNENIPNWDQATSTLSKYKSLFFHEIISSEQSLEKLYSEKEYPPRKINQKIKNSSLFCQRLILKAMDQNRNLNQAEIMQITERFNSLEAPLDQNNQPQISLINDIQVIKQITPLIIKISENFVKVINSFEIKLKEHLIQNKAKQKYIQLLMNSSKNLFPEELCTRKNFNQIKEAQLKPDLENKSLNDSLKATSIYLTHFAMKKPDMDAGLVKEIFNLLAKKIKVVQQGQNLLINAKNYEEEIKKEQLNIEKSREETVSFKNQIDSQIKEFETLKSGISKTTYLTFEESASKIMALIRNINANEKVYLLKIENLKNNEGKINKKIEILNEKKKECVEYLAQQSLSNEIQNEREMNGEIVSNLKILSDKPELLFSCYSIFAKFLENRIQKQPEESKGWFSFIW